MAPFGFFAEWIVGLANGVFRYDVLHVRHGYLLVGKLVGCVRSSRAERPWLHSREFKQAVAMARPSSVTRPPPGSWRKSFVSSSSTAFSATGFLLTFFTRPTSMETPRCRNALVFVSETNPGAGSTRMTALGPSKGCRPTTSRARASRRVSLFSSGTIHDVV